jgi:hypothetical protein
MRVIILIYIFMTFKDSLKLALPLLTIAGAISLTIYDASAGTRLSQKNDPKAVQTVLGREHILITDSNKVQDLQDELIIQRSLRTMELTGSSWAEYKRSAGYFPALQAIPPSYNKMNIDWSQLNYDHPEEFILIATDTTTSIPIQILVHSSQQDNEWGVFFIRIQYSSGDELYGPFIDNIDKITKDLAYHQDI